MSHVVAETWHVPGNMKLKTNTCVCFYSEMKYFCCAIFGFGRLQKKKKRIYFGNLIFSWAVCLLI